MLKFLKITVTSALLILGATIMPIAASAGQSNNSILVEMFTWWNQAFKNPNGFTNEAFGQYFTEDASLIIDGNVKAKGLDALVRHFRNIQSNFENVEAIVPFQQEFPSASGDRLFTYHYIKFIDKGKIGITHAAGYADIKDGKIALIHLIRSEEPNPEKLGFTK